MSKNAGYKKLIAAGRKNKYKIAGAAVAVAVFAASLIKKAHKNGSKTVSYKLPHEGDIILYRYSFLMADNKNGYVDINTSGCQQASHQILEMKRLVETEAGGHGSNHGDERVIDGHLSHRIAGQQLVVQAKTHRANANEQHQVHAAQ